MSRRQRRNVVERDLVCVCVCVCVSRGDLLSWTER